ncbi:MAG: lamin tail domain-containing protein [Bacteroidetes bacterium]|nr:lamin tail domain-containing protein [Bacteroidota bacterium]
MMFNCLGINKNDFMKKLLFLILWFCCAYAHSQTVVISQVYGGGGNTGATYNQDFVELFNASSASVDISGWSIQYASATGPSGTGNWAVAAIPANTTLAGGKYFLIALATGSTGNALPTPDLTNTTINLSGTTGKIALVNNGTALNGTTACSASSVVDVLGYGASPTCSETSPFTASGIDNTKSMFRKNGGCLDANNNSTDFELLSVSPRNSATAPNSCSTASPSLTIAAYTAFSSTTVGTTSASQAANLSGANLTGAPGTITVTSSSTDFEVSSNNSIWGASATIAYSAATLAATPVYVRFKPQAVGARSGNLNFSGGGATTSTALSGTGVAITAPVATAGTAVSGTGFTANWNAVTGAAGYYLDVYSQSTGQVTSILAGWNFTTAAAIAQTADAGNANNISIQTLTPQGFTGNTISWPGGPTVTTGANPYAVSTNGWDNGADTKYWIADVNTTGATSITVSSLQGSSNTGPKDFKLQYRVGTSGTWTDVMGGTVSLTTAVIAGNVSTWGALTDVALPADAANKPLVSVRWLQTSNNSVGGATVASGGTSRISAVYVKGSTTGTVNNYILQNQNVGNVTSYGVTGLTAGATYYYVVRAIAGGVTSVNSNEIAVTTSSSTPTITPSTLTAFGNVCINTTAGPHSFTITGTNLTSGNLAVASLTGFSYATAANGTYAGSLSIPVTGGSLSQEVFVKFNPTAVQSYNGNISLTGAGLSAAVTVAAAGAGVNTPATTTTGAASSVTQTSATVAGTITAIGCSTVSAYGIEYSTTNGFTNGTGTRVASSNLASGNFSVALSGLSAAAIYYYKAYATNSGGTSYGGQQSFTTAAPPPAQLTISALAPFGEVCVGAIGGPNSFTILGTNLTNQSISVGPLAGFTFSQTSGGSYSDVVGLSHSGGTQSLTVYVRFVPTAVQTYTGSIPVSGGGTTASIVATGTGVNTPPSITTGTASAITTSAATLASLFGSGGCTMPSGYGVEYSTINGFANGTGTRVAATVNTNGNFTVSLSGLQQGTTYYFKGYVTAAGAISYGAQQNFTTLRIGDGFKLFPSPAERGVVIRITHSSLTAGNYTLLLYSQQGQCVWQKQLNVQGTYINEFISLPANLAFGIYRVVLAKESIRVGVQQLVIQ